MATSQSGTRSPVPALVAILLLGALAWWAVASVQPPDAEPADAPAAEFSAGRAMAHVERIGTEVHVAGSPAADEVRQYIINTLDGLGLDPVVQDAIGADDALGGFAMARVQNVVAVIPGTASTGRVVLMAHYDSVQVSYGANDDGAGVSTLLETARALVAGPPQRNDIVLLFTDAEEACLCGAEAFVTQSPLAADGGVVLNVEARGSSGPAIMFETTRDNADLVDLYAGAVPYPVATNFAVEVYRILPNDTDFSPLRDSGRFTGLNSAYIDGSATYHAPEDRPEYLSTASLQHHGANTLALAYALGGSDIGALSQPSSGDATYFPVLGHLLVYPGWWVWPLAVLAVLLVAAAGLLAVRRGFCTGGGLAAAGGLGLIPLILGPAAAQGFWLLMTWIRPGWSTMIDPWRPGWFRIAVVALVLLLVLGWFVLLRRRLGAYTLAVAGLGWLAVLGAVLAAFAPGGSYLAAIPAGAGALAIIIAMLVPEPWSLVPVTLGGAVAVLVLAPTVALFFPALGLATGAAAALFATLLALVLLPVLDGILAEDWGPAVRRRSLLPVGVVAVVAVAATTTGLLTDRFDARHPAPVELMYAMEAGPGTPQAWWVRPGEDPTGWSDAMVTTGQDLGDRFPLLPDDTTVGPATPAALTPPEVQVVAESAGPGGTRQLQLRVTSVRGGRLVYVELPSSTVVSASVQAGRGTARDIPVADVGEPFGLLFHAPPADGILLSLTLQDPGPAQVRVMDGSDGLSALPGFVPRPVGVGVLGSHTSETALVATTVTV
ncbi:M28 family peptidase [Nakamurella sp. YIM 132087]|uniref:Vacuolar membrane protease n=1 Tax=Nakamurella alba TaxID=2665158 RepID=A0A7K1FMM8_9ACTN|nr:M28 family peptidase [Nakamurella alba]MTD15378.1 M28 family peptidase [Nakamurella alba]